MVVTVSRVPGIVGQEAVTRVIAMAKARGGAGPTGIFPLRLGWQTISAASRNSACGYLLLREQGAVVGGIGPTDILDRPVKCPTERARIGARHRLILQLGDRVN